MPVASLSAIALLAAVGQATVGASAEVSSGLAPIAPSESAEPTFISSIAPFAEGEVASRRNTLTLGYTPTLRLRIPSVAETLRPLLLHRASVGDEYRATFRTTLRGSAVADYGAVDYADVREVVGGDESTNIREASLSFVSVSSAAGVTHLFSRRWEADLGIQGYLRAPMSSSADRQMPSSYGGTVGLTPRSVLSLRDTLEFPASFTREVYCSSGDREGEGATAGRGGVYDTLSLSSAWAHQMTRGTSGTVSVGAVHSHRQAGGTWSSPTASAGLSGPLGTARSWRVAGRTSVGWTAQLDPLTARFRPAVGASGSLRAVDVPWALEASVSGYTATTRTPLEDEQPESALSSEIQASRARHRVSLRFGVRASIRASHLAAPTITASEPELLGFVGVDFAQSVGRGAAPQAPNQPR